MTVSHVLLLASTILASATQSPLVDWDAFRNYDLYALRPDDMTRMFSSYDRTDKNDDGFEGTYSCLYNTTAGRCVIAEADGPGQISDIWFTYLNNSVLPVGDVQIELDGKVVLDGIVQDVVDGDLGTPFVWSLVGNTNDTSGGNVIKVPMPYQESMRVSTSTNPHFYHLMYRTFPQDVKVEPFDPEEDVSGIIDSFRTFGVEDPKATGPTSYKHQETKQGITSESLEIEASGIIDEVQIRIPEILGASVVTDDGRAFGEEGSSNFEMQKASVTIDGQHASYWEDSGPAENATWCDQILEMDPALTQGKYKIAVTNAFESSDLDFNEFFYALHCLSHNSDSWQLTDLLNVGWNNQEDEKAHAYHIENQTWQGLRNMYTYSGERQTQARASIDALNDIYIHMSFDGNETVSQPLGSFFNVALGKNDVRSLVLSVDSLIENGAFTSWFPMPFSRTFSIHFTRSSSSEPISGAVSLKYHQRSLPSSGWGYFSTHHHRAQTTTGELWPLVSRPGYGIFYGVTHTIRGSITLPNNTLGFLEGDFKVWYNRTTPGPFADAAILGTGTEDFYESGWYYADAEAGDYGVTAVPYAMPLGGLSGSLYGREDLGCVGSCLGMMRLMLPESLAFDDGISVNIEHGPVDNNVNAECETTAFYYAP